ncbi:MAG: hypothetical protein HGA71_09315 [Azonexaceae bacterium]|nr:hypothetical protein [Azonexaceae bacterium]
MTHSPYNVHDKALSSKSSDPSSCEQQFSRRGARKIIQANFFVTNELEISAIYSDGNPFGTNNSLCETY